MSAIAWRPASATTAGADVASLLLAEPGPGAAESTLVALNVLGIVRYAPSLTLFAVGLLAGPALPRLLRWSAGLLAVATLVPVTGWVAALLAPVWLGVAGCLARRAPGGPVVAGAPVGPDGPVAGFTETGPTGSRGGTRYP
jgi:hypothetical protein